MNRIPPASACVALAISLVFAAESPADDWPQWRGPHRDGVWREDGIVDSIPASGLKIRWRARIGNGYSGPVVARGRVFVTDHQFRPEVERVVCLEETTGKTLWVHSYPCDYEDMEYGNGPRVSPTVHEGKVYTLGTQGQLLCLDAARGAVLWKKDLVEDFNARIPRYGASAAPVVVGDLLIVCAGGQPEASVVALDRHSGAERWRALKDRPAYSAPLLITAGGCQQLIVWTADNVTAFEPATGKVYWQVPYKTTFDEAQVVASPVLHKDRLLCLSAWNRGSFMLSLDPGKPAASVLWKTRTRPSTSFSTPVFLDPHHFYAIENDGSLCCLDATNGKEVWQTHEPTGTKGGSAHLTPHGDRVFLFNQKGHLILARLSPKGYQEVGRCLLIEATAGYRAQGYLTWAHPAYANKCVFARNDRELVCASLAAEQFIRAVEPKQTAQVRPLKEGNVALGLAFAPDGKTLALGNWSGWGTVSLLEVATGATLPAPTRHKDSVCAVAFAPDGKLLVSAGGNEFKPARNENKTTGEVKLWDVVARKELAPLRGHTNKVFAAVFAPDGKMLATGGADTTIRLWDAATGKERHVLQGHREAISSMAFSPDGKTLASASWDQTVKFWDVATGKERSSFKGHDESILAVAIAPDGKTLATGSADWTIRLWDLATQTQRATLQGHQGAVNCLTFAPDGNTLASGSGDETVRLWDVATGNVRTTLRGHRSGIAALAFTPDGRTLASAGMGDGVRLWELASDN